MPKIDNERFYTSAIKMYGTSPKGVNWASSKTQKIRFKTILELLPKSLASYTLLDAGCGFGDLYTYLQKKKILPLKYTGVDALQEMKHIAEQNTSAEILIADIINDEIPKADYVVCSGAMNTLTRDETLRFIARCYESSNIAFVFNILHGDKESETYNYFNLVDLKLIARELNVQKMELRTDYLDADITLGFYK